MRARHFVDRPPVWVCPKLLVRTRRCVFGGDLTGEAPSAGGGRRGSVLPVVGRVYSDHVTKVVSVRLLSPP